MELKNIYQFSKLDDESLKLLERIIVRKKYQKDNIVFYEGDLGDRITILSKGLLKVYKTDKKGNEITIHLFSEPTMVAEMPIFEEIRYPATSRFESDGEIIFLDYKKFKEILESNSNVAFSIIRSLTKKIKFLENTVSGSMGKSAGERVAKFLYDNEEVLGQLKNYTMAGAINITPETFSRELKKLKDTKIIVSEGGGVRILNKEALKKKFN